MVKDELHGLAYLIECLDDIIKEITPSGAVCLLPSALVEGDHHYTMNVNITYIYLDN